MTYKFDSKSNVHFDDDGFLSISYSRKVWRDTFHAVDTDSPNYDRMIDAIEDALYEKKVGKKKVLDDLKENWDGDLKELEDILKYEEDLVTLIKGDTMNKEDMEYSEEEINTVLTYFTLNKVGFLN